MKNIIYITLSTIIISLLPTITITPANHIQFVVNVTQRLNNNHTNHQHLMLIVQLLIIRSNVTRTRSGIMVTGQYTVKSRFHRLLNVNATRRHNAPSSYSTRQLGRRRKQTTIPGNKVKGKGNVNNVSINNTPRHIINNNRVTIACQ